MRQLFIIPVAIIISSFSVRENTENQLLLKTWIMTKFISPKELTYQPASEFGKNFGYQFSKNGKLLVQQSARSCPSGETEIKFEVVKGKWLKVSDSVIVVSHLFRGSEIEKKLLIVNLTENELTLREIR